jgi:acyl-CoA thioesterase
MSSQTKSHLESIIRERLSQIPYTRLLGIELETATPGLVTLGMDVRSDLKRNNGIAHGGAIASLVDSATAFAIISQDPDQAAVTIDLTVSFLRPLVDGRARATARIIRSGRRIAVVSAEVFDEHKNLVATALSTYIKD